ncbi:MAG: Rieske (2Fe-2S) protein [Pyrinomonadaceae bacterium]
MIINQKTNRTVIVGKVQDLPQGRGATVILDDGTDLALFNIGGKFFAVDNACPHRGVPLADGKICANLIECGGHGWRFDLQTGYCLDNPQERLNTYHVFIENEDIKIVIK